MSLYQAQLAEVAERHPQYAYEAYEFVLMALPFTQKMLDRIPKEEDAAPGPEHHVSGPELLAGIRALALQEFGRMARVVFKLWGINRTDDFGEVVFCLVEENLMSKTDHDCRADFHNIYDLDKELVEEFHLELDEPEWQR